ncbi:hypothetical protein ASE01_12435 [Nocardioides sp. Root190]|uniref:hypothetical protein n=1 Tax=Nocardioides sp. Root190 TaxID=1736488 RepID=UPI0006FB89C4|nr:hypothetical protein [Nocardioides sp. Root190]KRB75858.1 hypothetical protein ASE01_12435 [Nocardioides sp. Root190]
MSTGRAEPRNGQRDFRRRSGVAVLALLLAPLSACSDDVPPPTYSGGGYDDVATLMQKAVNARATALRTGDLAKFRRTLDRADSTLVQDQQTYFDNLEQLPVGALRIQVLADTISPVEGTELDGEPEYWAEVSVALRLKGYDAAPVITRDRFLFVSSPDGTRLVVGSTTDYEWEAQHPGNMQPWDLGPVRVETVPGVLGIFDDQTDDTSDLVLDMVASGRSDVRAALGPGSATRGQGVVVYAVSDPAFLDGLAGQTVGDPDRADGLTIAVPADAADPSSGVASYRIFLNPRVLDEKESVVGRLVRHELTHALLGARGLGAPLWLNEGLAEFVSVQSMPQSQRRLPATALDVGATVTDLPGEEQFGGASAEAWYAVSWWVCEYIASTYGEQVLLLLLDRLEGGTDQAEALESVLGISSAELAQRGVALMATTYAEPPEPPDPYDGTTDDPSSDPYTATPEDPATTLGP